MLDFSPVRKKEMSWAQLAAGLAVSDLRQLTNEMIDRMQALIEPCTDSDVVFVPVDEEAHDAFAQREEDIGLAWTLGHVIVHTTASAEESAFLAAELARGVSVSPRRSRSERPWQTITTIAQCRQRLEESRRMRLASLEIWPDDPYLDNFYESSHSGLQITAVIRFILGLAHDDSHLGQMAKIVGQAHSSHPAKT